MNTIPALQLASSPAAYGAAILAKITIIFNLHSEKPQTTAVPPPGISQYWNMQKGFQQNREIKIRRGKKPERRKRKIIFATAH